MTSVPYMCGIDEAGRGPVLGDMVYAAAYCAIDKLDDLKAMGFADSKTLNAAKRDDLMKLIKTTDWLKHDSISITAVEMSSVMVRPTPVSINQLAHDTTIAIIRRALDQGYNIQQLFVDTVGDPKRYQSKLESEFPSISQVTVTSKADSLFPIVSAASIVAKTTRDDSMTASRANCSGYPGDPATKAWLVEAVDPCFGFPPLVRFGWQTTKTAMADLKCHAVTWYDECDEGFDEQVHRQPKLDMFMQSPTNKTNIKRKKTMKAFNLNLVQSL